MTFLLTTICLLVVFLAVNQQDTLSVSVFLCCVRVWALCGWTRGVSCWRPSWGVVAGWAAPRSVCPRAFGGTFLLLGRLVHRDKSKTSLITCLSPHNLLCSFHCQLSPWKWNRWANCRSLWLNISSTSKVSAFSLICVQVLRRRADEGVCVD